MRAIARTHATSMMGVKKGTVPLLFFAWDDIEIKKEKKNQKHQIEYLSIFR